MIATFETTTGIVRVLTGTDPYVYSCAVAIVGDEGTAIVKALTQPPGGLTTAHRTAIFDALRKAGFEHVHWRRRDPLAEGGAVRDETHTL